jgi:hypothetical protein
VSCGIRRGFAVLVAAFALAAPAAAGTSRSADLSRVATAFRGGKVQETVYCAQTKEDWSVTLAKRRLPAYAVGFAYIGVPRVWLSPSICAGVSRADPWAALVFVHELIHTTGVRGERRANCLALARERAFLQQFYGLSAEQAQSVYEQSLARAMAEPERYRPVSC